MFARKRRAKKRDDNEDLWGWAIKIGETIPGGKPLWATAEESVLLTAPPRSGKSSQLVIPAVLGFEGPVLVTSTKLDVLAATYQRRQSKGPVWVIDPSGISGWPDAATWSLTGGCEDVRIAQDRAQAMIDASGGGAGVENGSFWTSKGRGLLSCWLAAAAVGGFGAEKVREWAQTQKCDDAVELLRDSGLGAMADQLYGFLGLEARARDNFWAIAQLPLDALMQTNAGHAVGAVPGEGLDLDQFFSSSGTIYLLADEGDQSPLRGIMTALVAAVTTKAKRLAQRSERGRLDFPTLMVLDEAANICPLPAIPALMSVSGSQSLLMIVVLQSMVQGEQAWGRDGMRMLFANARLKMLLGGQGDTDELERWAKLAGMYDAEQVSTSYSHQGASSSASLHRREVIDVGQLRAIQPRHALVLYADIPPAIILQHRVHEGPYAGEISASGRKVHELIAGGIR